MCRPTGRSNGGRIWVTAMPPPISASAVRCHARNVRSLANVKRGSGSSPGSSSGIDELHGIAGRDGAGRAGVDVHAEIAVPGAEEPAIEGDVLRQAGLRPGDEHAAAGALADVGFDAVPEADRAAHPLVLGELAGALDEEVGTEAADVVAAEARGGEEVQRGAAVEERARLRAQLD